MVILTFLTQLFGATMLLLFAVRMVRTGVERVFGARFQRLVISNRGSIKLVPLGAVLAILLQSSAAVTLLVASLAASGTFQFVPAIALVLGGDLGSALIIQLLSLKLNWMSSVLLVIGGILFLKTERRILRQTGRIVFGVAFILISLDLLRETVEPIRDTAILPAMASYLEYDYLTAFILGAVLAFVMHSSVAAILMYVTLVAIGALPFSVGVSLVLGANLGSALIPVWLSRGYPPEARRIPMANLLIRGFAALMVLFLLNNTNLQSEVLTGEGPQGLILLHIAFNAILLMALPFCGFLERVFIFLLPEDDESEPEFQNPAFRSVLVKYESSQPSQALATVRREVCRMAGILENMFVPVMQIYKNPDAEGVKSINEQDEVINSALDGVRRFAADLPRDDFTRDQRRELRALVDYAIALEAAGDIVVKRLLPLAEEMHENGQNFSSVGRSELEIIHEKARENLGLAMNVLISLDIECARLLLESKADMARIERKSRKHHMKRLSSGDVNSLNTSDKHVETAYLIREFNSWIASVAYPILEREGQLLETRLVGGSE